jgi:hypothetical protein
MNDSRLRITGYHLREPAQPPPGLSDTGKNTVEIDGRTYEISTTGRWPVTFRENGVDFGYITAGELRLPWPHARFDISFLSSVPPEVPQRLRERGVEVYRAIEGECDQ